MNAFTTMVTVELRRIAFRWDGRPVTSREQITAGFLLTETVR